MCHLIFSSVQSRSRVQLSVTPWTAARQASLSITNSRSLLKLMSIESVMPLYITGSHIPGHRYHKALLWCWTEGPEWEVVLLITSVILGKGNESSSGGC